MLAETKRWWDCILDIPLRCPIVLIDDCVQLAIEEFSGKPIIGGKDCEAVTKTPADGETFNIGSITVKALYTPCHTQDSISWFMQDNDEKAVFTGDTLFIGGTRICLRHMFLL